METKKAIRQIVLNRRNSLSHEQREDYSRRIFDKIILLEEYVNSDNLLLYLNYQKEVSTAGLLKHALEMGKNVFCPRVVTETEMNFFQIRGWEDIRKGYKGIEEPTTTKVFEKNQRALMILPMTGFDESKNRLGYGKGFYDRFLQTSPQIYTLGLAFECQKWDHKLITDDYDVALQMVMTEDKQYL